MVETECPQYANMTPLGNAGDDGLGIKLGVESGGATLGMDRCSAWKFINPPHAFPSGILVGPGGRRVGNEDQYGVSRRAGELV